MSQITSDGLTYRKENAEYELKADKILLAAGRTPIVDSIGLDAAGVEIHEFGIDTDEHMCTNVPNLYAAGDVTGKSMLAHTAYREAEVAVNHMLEKPDRMRYHTVPSVIYTNPEVASVGYTKAAAEERGHQVREVKIPLQYSGRYVAEVENGNGVCKLIVDTQFNRLLGVHLFGTYASEIIYGAALMIETELRIEDLRELVFPHPTVGEAMREALFV